MKPVDAAEQVEFPVSKTSDGHDLPRQDLVDIAVAAASAIPGVQALSNDEVRRNQSKNGVRMHLLDGRAAFDISIVAENDSGLLDLAAAVRAGVIEEVESRTELRVTEVNVRIDDLVEVISH